MGQLPPKPGPPGPALTLGPANDSIAYLDGDGRGRGQGQGVRQGLCEGVGVRHFRGPGESTPRSERPKIPPSDH